MTESSPSFSHLKLSTGRIIREFAQSWGCGIERGIARLKFIGSLITGLIINVVNTLKLLFKVSNMTTHWWSKDTLAVVTGANKGIGYQIVRGLLKEGLAVILTARNQSRGVAAANALKAELPESRVWFHQLDVACNESVQKLVTWLRREFNGQIDILVNNAGIVEGPGGQGVNYVNAKAIVNTNYCGVRDVTEALLPLLRRSPSGARIVNVTSSAALYACLRSKTISKVFEAKFEGTKECTQQLFDSLAEKYLEDVIASRWVDEGWMPDEGPDRWVAMYGESKMFLNGYAIALAKYLSIWKQPEDRQIFVLNFCPGATRTDLHDRATTAGLQLVRGQFAKTPEEGADTGVWLALLPEEQMGGKHGNFFADRKTFLFPFKWRINLPPNLPGSIDFNSTP